MGLPTAKDLAERIKSGYDRQYYDSLYTQMQYAFGEKWNSSPAYADGGHDDIPVYQDVRTTSLQVGQSRRILNASIRTLSRVLPRPPEPKFTSVDEVTGEVRRRYWLANANGDRGVPTKWMKQLQYAFVEGDSLGVGVVKHGLRTHPKSGLQLVDLKHVPVLQCLWDPFESDPRNSRWVAVISYIPFDVAVALLGKKKATDNKRYWAVQDGRQYLEYVRVIEYWDVGYAGDDPAYALFTGSLDKDSGKVEENDMGFIPVSFCVNYVAPGMRRPIGRVMMQMSFQELINDIEKYARETMKKGPPVDVYLANAFDEDDLAAFEAGDYSRGLKINEGYVEDVTKAFSRISGKEVPQGVLALWGIAERQNNDDSNETEQTRGNALGSRTTAKEVQALNSRMAENVSLTNQQATDFLRDSVKGTMLTGFYGDRHPVDLDIFGTNVTFNDPNNDMTSIDKFLGEDPGNIVIDLESTTAQDDEAKNQARIQGLSAVSALVGITIDPMVFTDEMLEAMGEKDLERWRMKAPAPGTQPATQPTEQTNE